MQLKEARTNSIELQRQIGMNSQEAINWTKLAQSPIMRTQVEDLQELQNRSAQGRGTGNLQCGTPPQAASGLM